ncbi:MAG: maleylpyruvate isomerase N-terminal domain-containing protein, partial [Acidimicrobiales bacterium]|nr:maleylpyruvate isomerase N-terminal domain-containing protein [Acidimicrobiales bacterium]
DDIAAGAGRSPAEHRDARRATPAPFADAAAATPAEAWAFLLPGRGHSAAMLPWGRLREVEVHHVDLGLGYEPDDWPDAFVTRILPFALADVGHRLPGLAGVEPRTIVAWSYGRADPPAGLPVLDPF